MEVAVEELLLNESNFKHKELDVVGIIITNRHYSNTINTIH